MEIKIRYLKETELAKIDRIAKKIGISREEFLRRIIRKEIASAGEFLELDSESKVRKALAYQMKENNDLIHILIQQIQERELTHGRQN
jgi:Ribbon-helix-helix protein, copG family.